jgi:hypothetical protein
MVSMAEEARAKSARPLVMASSSAGPSPAALSASGATRVFGAQPPVYAPGEFTRADVIKRSGRSGMDERHVAGPDGQRREAESKTGNKRGNG